MSRQDEITFEMQRAAFSETEQIMTERGYSSETITREYFSRGIERLWADEDDRESLRTKVHALASKEIDAQFDSIGA